MYDPYADLDEIILDWLDTKGPATPRDIAESQRRENVIRVRCRELAEYGLVTEASEELFALSKKGEEYLKNDFDINSITRVIPFQQISGTPVRKTERRRIVDFSDLDPEDIVYQNIRFLEDGGNYGKIRGDTQVTRDRINNVSESDIQRVIDEFPRNEPIAAQCAHWVRAFSGLHFFPDANHRTAMASLSALLDLHGIDYPEWSGEGMRRACVKSKLIRILLVNVRFDNLWEKDEHYQHWHRFFRNCLYETEKIIHREYPLRDLEKVLKDAREHRTGI